MSSSALKAGRTGLTTLCRVGMTPDEALMRADHAMYEAKRGDKNRVARYEATTSISNAMPTGSSTSSALSKSS